MKIDAYNWQWFVELIDNMWDDNTPAQRARISYWWDKREFSEDSQIKLLERLIKDWHLSTIEHCYVTINFKAPIFIARQLLRHRQVVYSEVSRRYMDDTKEWLEFLDIDIRWDRDTELKLTKEEEDEIRNTYQSNIDSTVNAYQELRAKWVAKEVARWILPVSLMTRWSMSWNLRRFLEIFTERCWEHTQKEAREIAQAVMEILASKYPHITRLWKEHRSTK